MFAAGLALALAGWGEVGTVAGGLLLAAASGLVRAVAQGAAAGAGMAAAVAGKQALRRERLPGLLASAQARGRMAGEDAAVAIDAIEATEGLEARYRPLSRAARMAPLLVAGLVALASPVAAGILVVTLLPFGVGMALAGGAARVAADRQMVAIRRLNGLFADRVRALGEIRHFRAEARVGRQLAAASGEVAARTLAVLKLAFVSGSVLEFLAALSVALVALYCGFALLGLLPFPAPERLGLAAAFFALAMAVEFYLPMRRLAAAYHERQMGEAAEMLLWDEAPQLPAMGGPVAFGGLRVRELQVQAGDGPVIGPISFEVPAGGLVVLVGATGSGKTSILMALAGLREVVGGELLWGMGEASAPAWAGQRPLVVAGSIAENIGLGGDGDVEATAAAVGLEPVLAARGGLGAMLDARGSGLSGGERRRLGLARALASGRALMLLDEPTADLDEASAAALRGLLRGLAGERTLVVATHDAALAAMADQVVRLS